MGGGWKIAIVLLLLAAIAAVLWGRQGASEQESAQGTVPGVAKPDGSTRPARERPGREREERPGGTPEKK